MCTIQHKEIDASFLVLDVHVQGKISRVFTFTALTVVFHMHNRFRFSVGVPEDFSMCCFALDEDGL